MHTDLWGPSHKPSSQGYGYYIAFVDACTRFTWLYFLKAKSDALNAFTQFYKMIDTQFSIKFKVVQSDFGGEFRPFTKMLDDLGVLHRLTCPHTSHQNGAVECKHCHIVEMGLTLLAQASLPISFWDHSFTAAVYLINRLPSSAISEFTSPYHALHNKMPNYSMLRTIGCLCFPHLRPYNQHKLQFRSMPCINLGISPRHRGYKCLNHEGRIYISKDVIFDENTFPYPSLYPTSSTTAGMSSNEAQLHLPLPPQAADESKKTSTTPASVRDTEESSSAPSEPSLPATIALSDSNAAPLNAAPVTNTHPMITRGKTGHLKPRVFLAHLEPTNT